MRCTSCEADVPVTARFCPSCAAPILKETDVKGPADVTLEWLTSILELQGYKVDAAKENDTLIAQHESNPTLLISLMKKISLIGIQTTWKIKKPAWGQKTDLLAAINKANSIHWLCTCALSDSMDHVYVSSALFLTERISSRDILSFIDVYLAGIGVAIDNSGLRDFAL